mgnify:CR=1 FL=1
MGNVQMLLRQHVGAPCAPCVEVGAEVKKGTLIATPTGLGANIFSSVYGKVTEITEDRIIIEPDAEQPDEFIPVTESVEGITDESSKLDLVKAAGIVGMGGAGFPTGVKWGFARASKTSKKLRWVSLILRLTQSFRKTSNWIVDTFL